MQIFFDEFLNKSLKNVDIKLLNILTTYYFNIRKKN